MGCCGALKENKCMTATYAIILSVLIVLEISAGIAGYVKRDDVEQAVKTELENSMLVSYQFKAIPLHCVQSSRAVEADL